MSQRLLLNKDKFGTAFNQEYSVFTALAPKNLIELFEAESVSFPEYYKLLCVFENCNFKELSFFHRSNPNHDLTEGENRIFDEGTDEELDAFLESKGWDFCDDEYISLFKENIASDSLKRMFYNPSVAS